MVTLNKDDAIRLARQIQGWCEGPELSWLYDRASEIAGGGTWVEVGCWKGRSFCAAAFGIPDGCRALAFDHFEGNPESLTHFEARFPWWVAGHANMLVKLIEKNRQYKVQAIVVQMTSLEAAATFDDASVDAVYLDPDYRDSPVSKMFEACRDDIAAWLPKVKPGGLLCGRNHWHHFPGVQKAVDELLPKRKLPLAGVPGCSIWEWRRPS